MCLAITIRGGVAVPPQAAPEESMAMNSLKKKEIKDHRLFFKKRCGTMGSNCIYRIQKVLKVYINE